MNLCWFLFGKGDSECVLSYRAFKKMKTQSESSLLSGFRSQRGERVLEVDGTLTTQPVLEHVGISTWPGLSGLLMGLIKLMSC